MVANSLSNLRKSLRAGAAKAARRFTSGYSIQDAKRLQCINPKARRLRVSEHIGTGKGTFYHALKTIYGSYCYPITKKSDLHDRSNESLFDSLFVELDECLFAGNHEQANELKATITESTGTKEEKMKRKRKGQKRWFNLAAATNSDHAAKIECDDRRNCILSPKEENGGRPALEWATHLPLYFPA